MRYMDRTLVVYKMPTFLYYKDSPDARVRGWANGEDSRAADMRLSAELQEKNLALVLRELDARGVDYDAVHRADMKLVPDLSVYHRIISVGGDGTFLEVSHHNDGSVPQLGVNSDPPFPGHRGSYGFFCACDARMFPGVWETIDSQPTTALARMQLVLDGITLPEQALNDIFVVNPDPSDWTRYRLNADDGVEEHRDMGFIVSTAAGSGAFIYNEGGERMTFDDSRFEYMTGRGLRDARRFRFASSMHAESLSRECFVKIDGKHVVYPFTVGSRLDVLPGAPLRVIGDFTKKFC